MDFANLDADIGYDERLAYVKRHNPQLSDDQVEAYLNILIHRREKKLEMLERGYSNRLAERALESMQMPRPWGWHSVFFYPDSNTPRTRYLVLAAIVLGYLVWKRL